jgi:hypothetical protein
VPRCMSPRMTVQQHDRWSLTPVSNPQSDLPHVELIKRESLEHPHRLPGFGAGEPALAVRVAHPSHPLTRDRTACAPRAAPPTTRRSACRSTSTTRADSSRAGASTRTQYTSTVDLAPMLLTIASGSSSWRSKPRYAHIASRADIAQIAAEPSAAGRPWVAHTTDETTVEELSYTYSFANGAPHPRRRGANAVSEVRRVLAVEGGHDRSGHLRSGLRALRLLHQRRPARARQLGRRSAPSPSTSSTSTRSSARRDCNRHG